MDAHFQERHTDDLVKGRNSSPSGRYFITCRSSPASLLIMADAIIRVLNTVQESKDADIQCFTIMPDHVHLLLTLGERLVLSQVIGKFKSLTSRQIKEGIPAFKWQRNYFEHHVRPDEPPNPYARYIFMNPYRAGLVKRTERWPYWRCGASLQFDFQQFLVDGRYPPEAWFEEDSMQFNLADF